jgi:hypothetical protein
MTAREDAADVKHGFDSVNVFFGGIGTMKGLAADGLKLQEPKGNPALLADRANDYAKAAPRADAVSVELGNITANQVPEVWVGDASEKAIDVINAATKEVDRVVVVYGDVARELDTLAEALALAQAKYTDGYAAMVGVRNELDSVSNPFDVEHAQEIKGKGQAAAQVLLDAFALAEDAGKKAAGRLDDLASQARAGKLSSSNLTSADKLVLTQAAAPGGPEDVNAILTANDASRAGDRLDTLNAQDRARMDYMLDNAKSPQEKAYLLKALAAGHNVNDITGFDQQIHAHGDDPQWLRDRLTPIVTEDHDTTTGKDDPVAYQGQAWSQDQRPTCVAYSTMTARAQTDPLYSLQLTTGGHPDDPAFDNPQAFHERARVESERIYSEGRKVGFHLFGQGDGMDTKQGIAVANDEISPATGGHYEHKDLNNADDRRNVLPDVEHAVDNGQPVPVQVRGDGGHQMMIIGHDGDKLEIYNPWGYTVWVSEDDFVNGHMDKASDQRLPNADGVHIPKD